MEKILHIDGRPVKFKSTGAFLLRYKAQFKRDPFKDLMRLEDAIDPATNEVKNIEAVDLEVFYDLIWVLAKTADHSLPPPMDWLDGFSEFPLMEIIPEVVDLLLASLGRTVGAKK